MGRRCRTRAQMLVSHPKLTPCYRPSRSISTRVPYFPSSEMHRYVRLTYDLSRNILEMTYTSHIFHVLPNPSPQLDFDSRLHTTGHSLQTCFIVNVAGYYLVTDDGCDFSIKLFVTVTNLPRILFFKNYDSCVLELGILTILFIYLVHVRSPFFPSKILTAK